MDLNSMYQAGMGPMASFFAGQNAVNDQQMQAQQLRGLQLQNDQMQAMNPLNQQFMQGRIDAQAAELPGLMGQSQSLQAQGQYDQQTLASKVAERLSQASDAIGTNGMRSLARDGAIASQTASVLAQYPPFMHKQVAGELFQKFGGSPDSPILKGLQNVPDDHVAQSLAAVGKGMAMASGEYLQNAALQDKKLATEKAIAAGNNSTSIRTAEIQADSRTKSAKIRAQQMAQTMGVDKAIASYEMSKARNGGVLSPEDEAALQSLKVQQLQARAAGAPALPAQITNNKTPLQNAADAVHEQSQTPTPAPAPAAVPNALQIQHLKQHPELRGAFDAKFGAGASKSILGN